MIQRGRGNLFPGGAPMVGSALSTFWHLALVLTAMGAAAGLAMSVVLWTLTRYLRIPF